MLPLIDNNAAVFHLEDSIHEVAVTGFRPGCGKSILAHAIALGFAQSGHKTCIVHVPTKGVHSNAFTQYMRTALGKSGEGAYSILPETAERSAFTRVVYDNLPDNVPHLLHCVYIAPDFAEDLELGVTCVEATRFKSAVQGKIAERWPDIQIEFVPFSRAAVNPQREVLAKTDWMVVRALEDQFLQGTEVAELRQFLRLAELNAWAPLDRL